MLEKCGVVTLASVTGNGYPRICAITKVRNNGFSEIYFMTSKRSHLNGKATHFIPMEIEVLHISPFTGIHLFKGEALKMMVGFMLVQGIEKL